MDYSIEGDFKVINELLHRINFVQGSMEEHILVATIEEELSKQFDFQVSRNSSSYTYNNWDYYIRSSITYPDGPLPRHNSRLQALLQNLELLRDTATKG